jgi:hypothetical protein
MEKCTKCGCPCTARMLHRTNPKGQIDAGWMCMPCIEKQEPELANNIKKDDDINLLNIIENEVKSWK